MDIQDVFAANLKFISQTELDADLLDDVNREYPAIWDGV